ncbi:CPBP family intramembrane glutamic endopeptidase [Halobellus litoreus]|uniref:CPBP family intramembrane glutamic endopeptidase n=1 Tax=Halobellus litoreus TaxID=755310 RepID=A0ABD6E4S2_9EURY
MTDPTESRFRWLLRGRTDTRLRASLRILIAVLLTFGGALGGVLIVTTAPISPLYRPVFGHFFAVVAVLVSTVILARYIDHREITAYGFTLSPSWGLNAIGGFLIGVCLVGLAFGLHYQRGAVTVVEQFSTGTGNSFLFGIGVAILGWLLVGFWEETIFRGIFLKNAAEGLAARGFAPLTATGGAWMSSSLVYGFLHGPLGSNPDGESLLYALVMTAVMGGLFGLAYILSDELALPIGLHIGVNFAEHNVFFGPPSGATPALLRAENTFSGARIQFQSIDPLVIVPVFILGYIVVTVWGYSWTGNKVPNRSGD